MLQVNAAGVGYKMGNELTHMDIKTAADLRRISQEKLMQKFGERIGAFLYLACRGQVSSPVTMLLMLTVTGFGGQVSFPVIMLDFTCLLNEGCNILHDDNHIHTIIISLVFLYCIYTC